MAHGDTINLTDQIAVLNEIKYRTYVTMYQLILSMAMQFKAAT